MISISLSISLFSIFFLGGGWLSTYKSMELKPFTISMWGLICDLSCTHSSFTNLDVLLFGAQMLRIEMSSWSLLVRTRGTEPGPGSPSPKWKNSQNESRLSIPSLCLRLLANMFFFLSWKCFSRLVIHCSLSFVFFL